jgi:hypothetical protein
MSWPWRDLRMRVPSGGNSAAESTANDWWSTGSGPEGPYDGETGFSTGPSGVSSIVNWTESVPDAQQSGSPGA